MHERGSHGASFSEAWLGAANVPLVEADPGAVVLVVAAPVEAVPVLPVLVVVPELVLALVPELLVVECETGAVGVFTLKLEPVVTVTSAPSVVGPLARITSPFRSRSAA